MDYINDTVTVELSYTDIYCLALAMYYRLKELSNQPMTPEIFEEIAMLQLTNVKFMPIFDKKALQEQQDPIAVQGPFLEIC